MVVSIFSIKMSLVLAHYAPPPAASSTAPKILVHTRTDHQRVEVEMQLMAAQLPGTIAAAHAQTIAQRFFELEGVLLPDTLNLATLITRKYITAAKVQLIIVRRWVDSLMKGFPTNENGDTTNPANQNLEVAETFSCNSQTHAIL